MLIMNTVAMLIYLVLYFFSIWQWNLTSTSLTLCKKYMSAYSLIVYHFHAILS